MDLIQAMRIFSRVADTKSFTKAAKQLDVSVPVITRNIANLEAHLNARLLNRNTRRIALTDIGQSYLEGCRVALEQIEDAERIVARTTCETQGLLRILSSTTFSLTRLGPVFTSYQKKFPNIHVQLTLTDRHVDFVKEGIDAAILADYMVSSEILVTRPLLKFTYSIVAAPSYLQQAGVPCKPEHLENLCFIGRPADSRGHCLTLVAPDRDVPETSVTLMPSLICNNTMMLYQFAKEGMGIAILAMAFIEEDLRAGRLIRLLPSLEIASSDVHVCLVYPSRKFVDRKLRTLIDHVIEQFRGGEK
jgi:DNA-binding transcriptional LysR family regulator